MSPAVASVPAALDRSVRRLAVALGLAVALAMPAGYFLLGYVSELDGLHRLARLTAALTEERSRSGDDASILAVLGERLGIDAIHVDLRHADGRLVASFGTASTGPQITAAEPVTLRDGTVGALVVERSLAALLQHTLVAGLFGLGLGLLAIVAVYLLPLRALRQTLARLRRVHGDLARHAQETNRAYDELQQNHRSLEEAAQEIAKARDEAALASRTKSQLLANVSHELRTPLNAIIGFSEIIKEESFGPAHASYREYASDIHDSGLHLLRLISELLDLAKIEAGRMELKGERVDLAQVVAACRRLMRERALEAGLAFDAVCGAAPPQVWGDETKLKQVLLNIVSNAIKFTDRGGSVTIAIVDDEDGHARVTITDTGIGMRPEDIPRALEPFRQVTGWAKNPNQGTGLGLSLAKAFTELHGGVLSIDSDLGRGTTVTVRLPVLARMVEVPVAAVA